MMETLSDKSYNVWAGAPDDPFENEVIEMDDIKNAIKKTLNELKISVLPLDYNKRIAMTKNFNFIFEQNFGDALLGDSE